MAATFSERLREWREVVSAAPAAEDPEVLGGRQAERFLHTLVQSHFNFQGASLYPNKRVPAGHRRREIDLIVVTAKRIHIIEIKNWSGSLRIIGHRWVQTNRNGREIEHPDLVADHQDKNVVLIEYLRRQGVQLNPKVQAKYLSNKVIFMNPRLVVHDRAIANHPDVLLPHKLDSYLNQQRRSGFGERILGSLVQWCLDTESADVVMDGYFGSLTPDKVVAVRAAVDRLGTWDTLQYFGSRVEIGDLIRVSVGGAVVSREQIGDRCHCPVRWTRHKTWGLFKALTGFGSLGRLHLPSGSRPLSPADFVFFHRPGEPAPTQIPLLGLDAITLG
ncbi:MAG: nuclease-related domain-containing protein [Gemmataceae bacterium]